MPNDPQWGKKDNEGPPDLDEILRKLQQKISGLLGFRPRGPSGPSGGSPHYGAAMGGMMTLIRIDPPSALQTVDKPCN